MIEVNHKKSSNHESFLNQYDRKNIRTVSKKGKIRNAKKERENKKRKRRNAYYDLQNNLLC